MRHVNFSALSTSQRAAVENALATTTVPANRTGPNYLPPHPVISVQSEVLDPCAKAPAQTAIKELVATAQQAMEAVNAISVILVRSVTKSAQEAPQILAAVMVCATHQLATVAVTTTLKRDFLLVSFATCVKNDITLLTAKYHAQQPTTLSVMGAESVSMDCVPTAILCQLTGVPFTVEMAATKVVDFASALLLRVPTAFGGKIVQCYAQAQVFATTTASAAPTTARASATAATLARHVLPFAKLL